MLDLLKTEISSFSHCDEVSQCIQQISVGYDLTKNRIYPLCSVTLLTIYGQSIQPLR